MTVTQAAQTLGVHANTVRRWSKSGILHPVRLPRSGFRRFRQSDVLQLARGMHTAGEVADRQENMESVMSIEEQWASLVRESKAQGIHVDFDAYNARALANAPRSTEGEDLEIPEAWGEGFQTVTDEDLQIAFGDR